MQLDLPDLTSENKFQMKVTGRWVLLIYTRVEDEFWYVVKVGRQAPHYGISVFNSYGVYIWVFRAFTADVDGF